MIYIFLLIGIGLLYLIKKKVKQKLIVDVVIMLTMTIIYGIRYNVGRDYLSYEIIYINEYGWYNYEFLYDLFAKIFKFFNASFWEFNLFLGFIIFSLLYYIAKDLRLGYEKLIFYFILTGQLFVSFNLVRQTIAGIIIMFAFRFISRNKVKSYLICVFIASLFHTTALLFIPLYFIRNIRLNLSRVVILVILGISFYYVNFISLIDHFFVPDKYISLIGSTLDYNTNPGLGVFFYVLIVLILSLVSKKDYLNYYPFVTVFILFNSVLLFTVSSFVVSRITVYGHLAFIPVLPYLFEKMNNENKKIPVIYLFILLVYLFLFASTILNIFNMDTNNLTYRTIFNMY